VQKISSIYIAFSLIFLLPAIPQGETDYRDPEQLEFLIEEQAEPYILVDVRTKEEYDYGFIPTAINIPYDIIGQNLPTQDKTALIIVYCRSGRRSAIAAETLESLGFDNVTDFGGVNRWKGKLRKTSQ